MRYRQNCIVDAPIAKEEQVEIEGPRPPSLFAPLPTLGSFDLQQPLEQFVGRKLRRQPHRGIQIGTLVRRTHRFRLVDAREREQRSPRRCRQAP